MITVPGKTLRRPLPNVPVQYLLMAQAIEEELMEDLEKQALRKEAGEDAGKK